jgi:hypothetical protein
MPRKRYSLGDLRDMLQKYKQALAEARSAESMDAAGQTRRVDPEQVQRATAALDTAITELEAVCQDGVLAIIVDSDS